MTSPGNQRQTKPAAQTQRTEHMEDTQREEDEEELMKAMAEALSHAERDEQASQAAREATGDLREDARMMRGRTGMVIEGADNLLHEVLEQTMGRDKETPEDNRRRKGKAPAVEESMRTPEAARQCQTTPATTKYKGQTQPGDRLQHQMETSRATMGGADHID